jgi:hypothetical protein
MQFQYIGTMFSTTTCFDCDISHHQVGNWSKKEKMEEVCPKIVQNINN